ncbi:hypothetical protein [Streptomyces sp. OE57]|uniref:hypothetical protein n=1 Tax=Streptomyces lacaronensis TaxID=3379885 RepID=UPI0039B7367D
MIKAVGLIAGAILLAVLAQPGRHRLHRCALPIQQRSPQIETPAHRQMNLTKPY